MGPLLLPAWHQPPAPAAHSSACIVATFSTDPRNRPRLRAAASGQGGKPSPGPSLPKDGLPPAPPCVGLLPAAGALPSCSCPWLWAPPAQPPLHGKAKENQGPQPPSEARFIRAVQWRKRQVRGAVPAPVWQKDRRPSPASHLWGTEKTSVCQWLPGLHLGEGWRRAGSARSAGSLPSRPGIERGGQKLRGLWACSGGPWARVSQATAPILLLLAAAERVGRSRSQERLCP